MTDETIVAWRDDVDLRNIGEKRDEIDRVLDGPAVGTLVIDLAELDFVDSLGLGVLIHARDRCAGAGTALILRSVPPRTRKLLQTAGLDTLFTIEP
ncbi:STAS domain-containing protein [Jatrophihabitans endophyticus]|uniref:STAS domain-containing protein n=1 Tax=Jatrophihabitans endophyticus TaxID=1206085 RepID=UPI001A0D838D|nr:STAS domain-containing protein [Jatrophihabitans endophyticus]MBE7186934.1 STAS domain-containing protein [Jatrophihabitans endophyticus]